MKWLAVALLALLAMVQYRLWFAEGSLAERHRLNAEINRQLEINSGLRARNERLEQEVLELQRGLESLEERAREELGMIKADETYYQVLNKKEESDNERGGPSQ